MPDADYIHGNLEPEEPCGICKEPATVAMIRVAGHTGHLHWKCYKSWAEMDKPKDKKKGKR